TVGTITHASATWAVYPPSRPTTPATLAPTCFAYCNAKTRLGLTFFFKSPPPTEKTKTQSLGESLLTLSHGTKTEAHPSSFARAVNSETLSVGAYDSIPAILRKSFTAWEQFPALPPTPRKKSRPPSWRMTAIKSASSSI